MHPPPEVPHVPFPSLLDKVCNAVWHHIYHGQTHFVHYQPGVGFRLPVVLLVKT